MERIIDKHWFRTDEFEIVTEWPWGNYTVWAIGRENFPHPGFLPLAQPAQNEHFVRLDTLKALYVGDEALCLAIPLVAPGQSANEVLHQDRRGCKAYRRG